MENWLISRGKVRDLYQLDQNLLFVASDRISAFDVVMKSTIKDKGKILTQLSEFWFKFITFPNHLITTNVDEMPEKVKPFKTSLQGRCMLVKKLKMLPVEAIVRGYLSGSAWEEYKTKGTVHGIEMPKGLLESQKLPKPLFTPSTKAEVGQHDENIHPSKLIDILGLELAQKVEKASLDIYEQASNYAAQRGIIIADTKFEFSLDEDGTLILADEVLTPDSSRFWPAKEYKVGCSQPSFDKQFLRDYLKSIQFDKKTPVETPLDIQSKTIEKYVSVFKILTA